MEKSLSLGQKQLGDLLQTHSGIFHSVKTYSYNGFVHREIWQEVTAMCWSHLNSKINSSWWLNLRTILKAEQCMCMEVLGLLSTSPNSEFRQIWILITFPVPN